MLRRRRGDQVGGGGEEEMLGGVKLFFRNFFSGLAASRLGVLELIIGALSMRAFSLLASLTNLSDCSEIILITRLALRQKDKRNMCTVCVTVYLPCS